MRPQYDVYLLMLCPLLYFLLAWVQSDRQLASKLSYKVPFHLRRKLHSVQRFWIIDLAVSSIALVFALLLASSTAGFVSERAAIGSDRLVASYLLYPVLYVLMGLGWPKISGVFVGINEKTAKEISFSIGRLRDLFLGGSAIDSVNNQLQMEVESYVDRVVEAILESPASYESFLHDSLGIQWREPQNPSETDRRELRRVLLEHAKNNLEMLYLAVKKVRMIPLADRRKPLMKVPDITAREEELLHRHGVKTMCKLIRAAGLQIRGLPAHRLALLRDNAKHLMSQRFKSGLLASIVIAGLLGMGYAFNYEPKRVTDLSKKSPITSASSPEEMKKAGETQVYAEPNEQ